MSYKSELGTHQEELRAKVKGELQELEDTIAESLKVASSCKLLHLCLSHWRSLRGRL